MISRETYHSRMQRRRAQAKKFLRRLILLLPRRRFLLVHPLLFQQFLFPVSLPFLPLLLHLHLYFTYLSAMFARKFQPKRKSAHRKENAPKVGVMFFLLCHGVSVYDFVHVCIMRGTRCDMFFSMCHVLCVYVEMQCAMSAY